MVINRLTFDILYNLLLDRETIHLCLKFMLTTVFMNPFYLKDLLQANCFIAFKLTSV